MFESSHTHLAIVGFNTLSSRVPLPLSQFAVPELAQASWRKTLDLEIAGSNPVGTTEPPCPNLVRRLP